MPLAAVTRANVTPISAVCGRGASVKSRNALRAFGTALRAVGLLPFLMLGWSRNCRVALRLLAAINYIKPHPGCY